MEDSTNLSTSDPQSQQVENEQPVQQERGESVGSKRRKVQEGESVGSKRGESVGSKRKVQEGEGSKNKVTSIVWEHLTKKKECVGGVEFHITICNYCKHEMPAHPKLNGTTGLKTHLQKRCKLSPIYKADEEDKTQPTLTNDSVGGGLVSHNFNQQRLELKLIKWVIRDEHPFRIVHGDGFREFISDLCPRFKIPNRKKIAAGVWDLFLVEKAKIKSVIGEQRVSITTDTWTSIQNINYMVVTAHFLDSDWKLHKRIIAFTKITSHKGEDIGRCLESTLIKWGIDKFFSITVDNATANDKAVEYMSKTLKAWNTLVLDGEYMHLRCACHILNLIVKDGLKELNVSIAGIRNCVKFIHSSSSRLDKFREFCILFKMDKMSNVGLDVPTRWNSTFKLLEGAFKFRNVFTRMAEESVGFVAYFNEKEKDGEKMVGPPVDLDWDQAKSFMHFLQKFYATTLKLSATKTCTSNVIFQQMVALQVEIGKKCKDTSDPIMQSVASAMRLKFDKYWGSYEVLNKLVFIANVLDPRYKLQLVRTGYRNVGFAPTTIASIAIGVKNALVALYNEYKGVDSVGRQSGVDLREEDDTIDGDDPQDQIEREMMQERKEQQLDEITNEVDKYLSDPFESISDKEFKLLDWWRGNITRYPILSKNAKDVFSIPSSTVASENAFSLGRRIVDPFRASLTPNMVEALVCTSDWLRGEEFNFYMEPTDKHLEFYKELEEVEANVGAK